MTKPLAFACMLAVTAIWLPVQGKESSSASASPRAAAAPRKLKTPKAPVNTGYGESRKERDQRLLRECKGRPNAGACEGYAS